MTNEPTYSCRLCGRVVVVRRDGRGFPPDIAKRKLKRLCKADGCKCDPTYLAGFAIGSRIVGQEVPDAED